MKATEFLGGVGGIAFAAVLYYVGFHRWIADAERLARAAAFQWRLQRPLLLLRWWGRFDEAEWRRRWSLRQCLILRYWIRLFTLGWFALSIWFMIDSFR